MEQRQWECFVSAYEEKSITRAARKLHVVQPAVSMQLKKLEAELGFPLFERTKRGVIPTHQADQIYSMVVPLLLDLASVKQRAVELGGTMTGSISIGVNPSIAHAILGRTLSRFERSYPGVDLRIVEFESTILMDKLLLGELDVAIINYSRGRVGISIDILVKESLFFVHRRSEGAHASTIDFKEIASWKLVLPHKKHGYRRVIDDAAKRTATPIVPKLEIDSFSPIIDLVASSDMATILPGVSLRRGQNMPPLQMRRITRPRLFREIACAYRSRRPPSSACREFIDLMKRELEQANAA